MPSSCKPFRFAATFCSWSKTVSQSPSRVCFMSAKLDVGNFASLLQIAIVGRKSSSEPSVLERVAEPPLPRDSTLCTRLATRTWLCCATIEDLLGAIIPIITSLRYQPWRYLIVSNRDTSEYMSQDNLR